MTKFDYRLSNMLDEELQKLRCRANYHALKFVKPIEDLGHRLVKRMRKMAKRYIAIHLRFTLIYLIHNFVHIFCTMPLAPSLIFLYSICTSVIRQFFSSYFILNKKHKQRRFSVREVFLGLYLIILLL